jgi:hypothetical protein
MNDKKLKLITCGFLFSLGISLALALQAFAQTSSFTDSNVEYTFEIPEAKWKSTVKPSQTSPNAEFVYGDRSDGHLEIRKLTVKANQTLPDIIQDEVQKLQFATGYVAGKEETFKGALSGKVFNYEFVRAARNMSGRFYFLKVDDKTIYVLRFTAMRDKLRSLRNQTDSIARTFDLKKAK